jgi:hypothetical protein
MAGEVRLWQRAEVTIDGVTHTMGSLRSPTVLDATNNEIIDKTMRITTSAVQVWDIDDMNTSSAATLIWLENEHATNTVSVEFTIDVADSDGIDYLIVTIPAGGRIVLQDGTGQAAGTSGIPAAANTLANAAAEIEEIWAIASGANTDLKVVVVG